MDVELIEIRDFLAEHPPFDHLPAEVLERLPKELSVRYLRRGTPFPPTDNEEKFLYVVRKGAVDFRDPKGELVEKFGEGDVYANLCLEEVGDKQMTGVTVEDSLFYLMPCKTLSRLRELHETFNEHFTHSVQSRLRRAVEVMQKGDIGNSGLMTVEVGDLVAKEPISINPEATIREAAQLMSVERVSSLLILEDELLVGMITDRDLRTRVVAVGLAYDTPVREIMTAKLHKITADTLGFEALLTMTRLGVHHLPVVSRGKVTGIITPNDLIRHQNANSVYIVSDVRRCEDIDDLVRVSKALPELHIQILASGATGYHVGQAVSSVTDAITKRLIELFEQAHGPAPIPYAWVCIGSQARREQTVHTDQDNALILSDDYNEPEHGRYFEQMAEYVTTGLDACGFVFCPGKVMASNPNWRQPYRVWRRYFDQWIRDPDRKSLMLACNFYDMRTVCGDESLSDRLYAEVMQQTRNNNIFLAYMAANAMLNRPPLGFFRNFVLISEGDHAQTFDLKHKGLIPICDLARVYALSAGLPEINTLERFKAAADASALSKEGADNLEDAMEFISTLRARHQAEQLKRGEKPDNYVKPDDLSPLERSHLKDAFSVISTMQNALSQRYQTTRFQL